MKKRLAYSLSLLVAVVIVAPTLFAGTPRLTKVMKGEKLNTENIDALVGTNKVVNKGNSSKIAESGKWLRSSALTEETPSTDLPIFNGVNSFSTDTVGGETSRSAGGRMYEFTPDGKYFKNLSPVGEPDNGVALNITHAGLIYEGKFWSCQHMEYAWSMVSRYRIYDPDTWEQYNNPGVQYLNSVPYALVEDIDGTIYGMFHSESDGSQNTEFSTIKLSLDNPNFKTTKIADTPEPIWAMTMDKNGQLYGFSLTGSFYKIGKDGTFDIIDYMGATHNPGVDLYSAVCMSACYDVNTDLIYWSFLDMDEKGWIYQIKPATGEITAKWQLPDNDCFSFMYIPEKPEATAPSAPENLYASFPNGQLTGMLYFDIPNYAVDGTELSGDVTYKVIVNKTDTITTATSTYGSNIATMVELKEKGYYDFQVRLYNDAGVSLPGKIAKSYYGKDKPSAPANATAVYDAETKKVTLTWDDVTTTVNDGYINLDKVSYDVVRLPDNVVLAQGIKTTSLEDDFSEATGYKVYSYKVTAYHETIPSDATNSNQIYFGQENTIIPPYSNTFDTEDSLNDYIILDSNRDGYTWQYSPVFKAITTNSANDWFIAPPMTLEGGKVYYFTIKVGPATNILSEKFAVKIGTEPVSSKLKTYIIKSTKVTNETTITAKVPISTTGTYYIGVNGMAQVGIKVYNIALSEAYDGTLPDMVGNLTITPDANDGYEATISGTAPALDIFGNPLASISNIVIERDGVVEHTIPVSATGEAFSQVVTVPTTGNYAYTVYATNDSGNGTASVAKAYIGVQKPSPVTDLTIKENSLGMATISWTAPTTGVDGEPLAADKISYNIIKASDPEGKALIEGYKGTSILWTVNDGTRQDFASVIVEAVTEGGKSSYAYTDIIPVGKPYEYPYFESFDDGETSSIVALQVYAGNPFWGLYKDNELIETDADGTNGFVVAASEKVDEVSMLSTGKIDLSTATNPNLSFYTFNLADDIHQNINEIDVKVRIVGQDTWQSIKAATVDDFCGGETNVWKKVTIALKDYVGKEIQVGLQVTTKKFAYTMFDAISVRESYTHDLGAGKISVPEFVVKNQKFDISVAITNFGSSAVEAGAYTVELYRDADETPIATIEGVAIEPNAQSPITFEQTIDIAEEDIYSYYIKVNYAADEDLENNTTGKASATKEVSTKLTATELKATKAEGQGVMLNWLAPVIEGEDIVTVTEDFESYESFATSGVGEWRFIDNDKYPIGGYTTIDFPGIELYSLQSYFILDNSYFFKGLFDAHSGDKSASSLFRQDAEKTDDWIISPMLSGNAQTIKLYARTVDNTGYSKLEFLYSTDGRTLNEFVSVSETALSHVWTEYSFDIPAGSRYFAIRNNSRLSHVLVDDVTFEMVNEKPLGYNVYCNDAKINTELVTETSYLDANLTDEFRTYFVTAVYSGDESEPSNEVSVEESGIEDVVAQSVNIYVENQNIVVAGAEGKSVVITNVSGINLYCNQPEATLTVAVRPGVYIVKVDDQVEKLAVK